MMMTSVQPRTERQPARSISLARALRRAVRAIRDFHNEQVYLWECIYLANRSLAPATGPLRWVRTLDGDRLAGSHLPGTARQAGR